VRASSEDGAMLEGAAVGGGSRAKLREICYVGCCERAPDALWVWSSRPCWCATVVPWVEQSEMARSSFRKWIERIGGAVQQGPCAFQSPASTFNTVRGISTYLGTIG
jgi:hypothetical protein